MPKLERIIAKIDALVPNEYNANKMSEQKLEALMETIKRYGQTHPIQVVQTGEDKYRIIGGEHRWRAMKLLKYTECEIVIRQFEDETEEQLGSLEDNLHGNTIPVKEALIIANATKKYKLHHLRRRLGEDESELKDKLLLVQDQEKLQKIADSVATEHLVEISFVLDYSAEDNANRLIDQLTTFAKKLGVAIMDKKVKLSKTKEAVALITFNVSDMQKNVIEQAVDHVMKTAECKKGRALELLSADYIAGASLPEPKPKKNGKQKSE